MGSSACADSVSTSGEQSRVWHRLVVSVPASVGDEVATRCFELGSCGMQADEVGDLTRLRVYFEGGRDALALRDELGQILLKSGLLDEVSIDIEVEPERDWNQNWRRYYQPEWATDRIVVHPPWIRVDPGPGQVAITIDPAMAFGTGGHESTQLALQALQETDCRNRTCLDVGTGSGVLSIAAIRLGAERVTAVDIDPVAVDNARQNLSNNLGTAGSRARVLCGSVDDVAGQRFDIVVANLESHLVRPLLPAIVTALGVDGVALLSGMITKERKRFAEWLGGAGLIVDQTWSKGTWFSLRARADRR